MSKNNGANPNDLVATKTPGGGNGQQGPINEVMGIAKNIGESVVREVTREALTDFMKTLKQYWVGTLTSKEQFLLARASLAYGLDPFLQEITVIKGRLYVAQAGLLRVAHRMRDLDGILPSRIDNPPAEGEVWYRAEIWKTGHKYPFVGIGRASVLNVTSQMRPWLEEMAQKRAVNRGLRLGYSIGIPSLEEMGTEVDDIFQASQISHNAVQDAEEDLKGSEDTASEEPPKEAPVKAQVEKASVDGPPPINDDVVESAKERENAGASTKEEPEKKVDEQDGKAEQVEEPVGEKEAASESEDHTTEEEVETQKAKEESTEPEEELEESDLADDLDGEMDEGEEITPEMKLDSILDTDVFNDQEKAAAKTKLKEVKDDEERSNKLFSYLKEQKKNREKKREGDE